MMVTLVTFVFTSIPTFADVNTKRSVSFGDSLTDNDLLFLLFPNDPAVYGLDPFEAAFVKAAGENDELTNYALIGARSADVLDQVKAYCELRKQHALQPATLVSLQAGGNDVFDNLIAFASAPPGTNPAVDCIAFDITLNILESIARLSVRDGRADFVVWTIPDVTQTPIVLAEGLPAAALANVRAHIESINEWIRLFAWDRQIAVMDMYAIMQQAIATPPTFFGMTLIGPPAFGNFDDIFADPIHPTAVSNAILANGIIATMNDKFDDDIPQYNAKELGHLAFPILVP